LAISTAYRRFPPSALVPPALATSSPHLLCRIVGRPPSLSSFLRTCLFARVLGGSYRQTRLISSSSDAFHHPGQTLLAHGPGLRRWAHGRAKFPMQCAGADRARDVFVCREYSATATVTRNPSFGQRSQPARRRRLQPSIPCYDPIVLRVLTSSGLAAVGQVFHKTLRHDAVMGSATLNGSFPDSSRLVNRRMRLRPCGASLNTSDPSVRLRTIFVPRPLSRISPTMMTFVLLAYHRQERSGEAVSVFVVHRYLVHEPLGFSSLL